MKVETEEIKVPKFTIQEVLTGSNKNSIMWFFGKVSSVLKASPHYFIRGRYCPVDLKVKHKELAEWFVERRDNAKVQKPFENINLLGQTGLEIYNTFVQSVNENTEKIKDMDAATIASIFNAFIDNEGKLDNSRLSFVLENYEELKENFDIAIIKANLKSDGPLQVRAYKELLGKIVAMQANESSLSRQLLKSLIENVIFEVVYIAAALYCGPGLLPVIIAGATADLGITLGSGFVNGLIKGIDDKSLFSLLKEPIVGMYNAYCDRFNNPDSLHPFWDTLIVSAFLTGAFEIHIRNIKGIQKYFPTVFSWFYVAMNTVFAVKGAIHAGSLISFKFLGTLIAGIASGYGRGLAKDHSIPYVEKYVFKGIENVSKVRPLARDLAIIPVTVFTSTFERLIREVLYNHAVALTSCCRSSKKEIKQKND